MVFWAYHHGAERWVTPEQAESRRQRIKDLRRADPSKHRVSNRRAYFANKEKNLARQHARRAAHPEKVREIELRSYRARREAKLEACRLYCSANPEKNREKARRRRARILTAIPEGYDASACIVMEAWRARLQRCTGIYWTIDHVLPLNAGGLHVHTNLQCLPARWNFAKRDRADYPLPDCYRRPE